MKKVLYETQPSSHTLYEKQGRKFVPVASYVATDYWRDGCYLVQVKPGSRSINSVAYPKYPEILVAVKSLENNLIKIIKEASEARPVNRELTKKELKVWEKLKKEFGKQILWFPSYSEIAEKIMSAIQKRAEDLKRDYEFGTIPF